jgi:hypothetical protein
MERAFDNCFPMMGEWGEPKLKKLPFATPLADVQLDSVWRAEMITVHDRDEQGNIVPPPPVDPVAVAARAAKEAAYQAQVAELKRRLAERRRQEACGEWPAADILSPETAEATACDAATERPPATECAVPSATPILSPETSAATECEAATKSPPTRLLLPDERLRRHQRQELRKERAAAKKVKAAKKRAQASRRRAA